MVFVSRQKDGLRALLPLEGDARGDLLRRRFSLRSKRRSHLNAG